MDKIMPRELVKQRAELCAGYAYLGVRDWRKEAPAIYDGVCSDCQRDVEHGELHGVWCAFWDAYPEATPF